jgi:hypothetical protein
MHRIERLHLRIQKQPVACDWRWPLLPVKPLLQARGVSALRVSLLGSMQAGDASFLQLTELAESREAELIVTE